MKERKIGTVKYPNIRWVDTKTLIVRGLNSNDTALELYVTLPDERTRRLSTLSCAIRHLKVLFLEIKEEIEGDIERSEKHARGW